MRRLVIVAVVLLAGLSAASVGLHIQKNQAVLPIYVVTPHPQLPPVDNFPCIEAALRAGQTRSATLHGFDWKLETAISSSCLPERDVALSYEVSKLLVNRTVSVRTHMMVGRRQDKTLVQIADSSGDEKQDMIAVGLVTNQNCTNRKSPNCEIAGGPSIVRID